MKCAAILLAGTALLAGCSEDEPARSIPVGMHRVFLESPGGELPFLLEVRDNDYLIRNGAEAIEVPKVGVVQPEDHDPIFLTMLMDVDSTLQLRKAGDNSWTGTWILQRGELPTTLMQAEMQIGESERFVVAPTPAPEESKLAPRYSVRFSSSSDLAVFVPRELGDGRVEATFLTTLGDYRYLAGTYDGNKLKLSCFDGAHAFLFHAERRDDGALEGDFWSRDTWHETWIAKPNDDAQLPDGFGLTKADDGADPTTLRFPDLNGKERVLTEPDLSGSKATVWIVFGSWCPNCHDATRLWAELYREYRDRGLQVVGLAFERSDDLEHERKKVAQFAERQGMEYPILIAGLANKQKASAAFPVLDQVRAFPTTVFRDASGTTKAVHTGFNGPATGEEHESLVQRFRELVEQMLDE